MEADPASVTVLLDDAADVSAPDEAALPPGGTIGRYVVDRVLGQGGMGRVYTAYDPQLDRRVALKLVRIRGTSEDRRRKQQERLLREAQALAQLAHPNVVAVFDAGAVDDGVFVAMELVEGRTLRTFLRDKPPTAEIIRVFAGAAQGLAAAHRAGIVHRDFKPDNVILGTDGRVRVLDFGLARARGNQDASQGPLSTSSDGTAALRRSSIQVDEVSRDGQPSSRGDGFATGFQVRAAERLLSVPLTRAGALLGTPQYMAPELLSGESADVRADQWAFAVTLFEALYGERPFRAPDVLRLRAAMQRGLEFPPSPAVPRRLRRLLRRALAYQPDERYPSMDALVEDLERDPFARWGRWVAVAAFAVAAAGTTLGVASFRRERAAACGGGLALASQAWSPSLRAKLEGAFVATGKPFAKDAALAVIAGLDDYLSQWTRMHREACEATRFRGEQSEQLLDARMACLGRHLAQVQEEVALFVNADATIVERGPVAVQALPAVAVCADLAMLRGAPALPTAPLDRAAVVAAQERLDRGRALFQAGRYEAARGEATDAAEMARKVGYQRTVAEAGLLLGDAFRHLGQGANAQEALTGASLAGLTASDDDAVAKAWLGLGRVAGPGLGHYAEADRYANLASSIVARPTVSEEQRAGTLLLRAQLARETGKYDEALGLVKSACASFERLHGGEHVDTLECRETLGLVLGDKALYADGLEVFTSILAAQERLLGPSHPAVAHTLSRVGVFYADVGKTTESSAAYLRAIAIWRDAFGPDYSEIPVALNGLANRLSQEGRPDEALVRYKEALALWEKTMGPEHPSVASVLSNIGAVLADQSRFEEALPYVERALAIRTKVFGPRHNTVGDTIGLKATVLGGLHRGPEAVHAYEEALAIVEAGVGPEHPDLVYPLIGIGDSLMEMHLPGRALPYLERAHALAEKFASRDPEALVDARFQLARVLLELHRDRPRAEALAAMVFTYARTSTTERAATFVAELGKFGLKPPAGPAPP